MNNTNNPTKNTQQNNNNNNNNNGQNRANNTANNTELKKISINPKDVGDMPPNTVSFNTKKNIYSNGNNGQNANNNTRPNLTLKNTNRNFEKDKNNYENIKEDRDVDADDSNKDVDADDNNRDAPVEKDTSDGNIPSVEKKTEGNKKIISSAVISSLNRLAMNLLNHQIVIKLFHFQTDLYGAHKASDKYLTKYAETMDKFLEIAQGIYGKITLKKYTLTGSSHTDTNIIKHIDGLIILLRKKIDDVLGKYGDLISIRDELVGDAEQLKYLLSFK